MGVVTGPRIGRYCILLADITCTKLVQLRHKQVIVAHATKDNSMNSINQIAAKTRNTRAPLSLPGVVLTSNLKQELAAWDNALYILAVLAVKERA